MEKYIAFDIGGTAVKYGLIANEKILFFQEYDTKAMLGGTHIIEELCRLVKQMQQKETISGVCISTAGMVNSKEGSIIYANDNIKGYTGMQIKKCVEETCMLPCEVENDVMCAGLCEQMSGAAAGSKATFCLTVGTGIGGCILLDGSVYHGASNCAGEIGYTRLSERTFEQEASTSALVRRVKESMRIEDMDGRKIFELAGAGNEICIREIDRLCENLAKGIANVCYIINPHVVVLGGGIMQQREYLEPILNEKLNQYLLPEVRKHMELKFAQNGNEAGMLGAYYNFMERQHK